jgi:broad specificity phosphatase PhoE
MLRLLLVRHGITVWNQTARRSGHTDIPLAEEGVEQARRLADRLRDERLDAVWSSDLQRARITAEIIAGPHGLTVIATPLLREGSHGAYEGLTREEVEAQCGPGIGGRAADAEPIEAIMARAVEARRIIQQSHPEGSVLVVGHLGPLRMLLCDAIGASLEMRHRFCMDNASLTILEYDADVFRVRLLNDTEHLR